MTSPMREGKVKWAIWSRHTVRARLAKKLGLRCKDKVWTDVDVWGLTWVSARETGCSTGSGRKGMVWASMGAARCAGRIDGRRVRDKEIGLGSTTGVRA